MTLSAKIALIYLSATVKSHENSKYIVRGHREQGIKGWMSNKQSIELLRKIAFY